MKIIPIVLAVAASIPLLPTAVSAYGQGGFSNQCFKEVYREEYTPGTVNNPGRVRRWTEQKEVPCRPSRIDTYIEPEPRSRPYSQGRVDDNSCLEGAIIGGVGGGALGGVLATQENWIWSIPTGIIAGGLAGCQVDGG